MNLEGYEINSFYRIVEKKNENSFYSTWNAEGIFFPLKYSLIDINKSEDEFSNKSLIKYKQELTAIYRISHPNIVTILEDGVYSKHFYIVTAPLRGQSLQYYFDKGRKFTHPEALTIIKGICNGLIELHNNNIYYGIISPNDIYIEEENLEALTLTHFGMGSLYNIIENSDLYHDTALNNYISPETQLMLNISLDERSDLFSLGVLFYRLLTGKFPYTNNNYDTFEAPSVICDGALSPVLDKIVGKLLAWNKYDRYWGAQSLREDIITIEKGIEDFEPGLNDFTHNPEFNLPLVDRTEVVNYLNRIHDNKIKKENDIVIITGASGVGKTRLVTEFSRRLISSNQIFLTANGDFSKKIIPYYVFKELFKQYLNYYSTFTDDEKKTVVDTLKNLGTDELLMIRSQFNDLDILLGKDTLAKEKKDYSDNFCEVFAKLFFNLGRGNEQLTFFIDSLNCIDDDSLLLLEELVKLNTEGKILIICTYDDKLKINDDVERFAKEYADKQLTVNNLNNEDIHSLTENIFKNRLNKNLNSVIPEIYRTCHGNVSHYLDVIKYLVDTGVIYFANNEWMVDHRQPKNDDMTIALKDIILKKVQSIKSHELDILTVAAAYAMDFELSLLFNIAKVSHEEIIVIVDDLVNRGLLIKNYTNNRFTYCVPGIIRDLLLEKLDKYTQKNLHERINDYFLDGFEYKKNINQRNDDRIFIIAHHYIQADNIEKTIEFYIKAAITAKNNYAFKAAYKYFEEALQIIEENNYNENWDNIKDHIIELSALQ